MHGDQWFLPGLRRAILPALCLMLGVAACNRQARIITVNNVEPRRDVTGEILDAHDGCLQFFNGRYYLYGTAYGRTDGMTNNDFRVYSSPDLEQWTLEGELL